MRKRKRGNVLLRATGIVADVEITSLLRTHVVDVVAHLGVETAEHANSGETGHL